jgi:PAS domain S-box-containing protein
VIILKGKDSRNSSVDQEKGINIVRGDQASVPLNAAIVGGGKACYNLLQILDSDRLSMLNMKILGVADINQDAPGMVYARELKLFTTGDFHELFDLEGLNLSIGLTGSTKRRDELIKSMPIEISSIDHRGARLLWDLIQMEIEKTELQKERLRAEQKRKEHIQTILDSLPYRIMVINLDKTIDTVNRTFLTEFGLEREEVLERKCHEVRYGYNRPCCEYGAACIIESGLDELKKKGLLSTMKEYKDRDGRSRFDVITIAPIFDDEGSIVQILETSRDVTGRIKSMTGAA